MRIPVVIASLLACILGTTALAATVTLTKTVRHHTTDWSPYDALTGPTDTPVIELYGSEIFEDYHSEGDPEIFALPVFDSALGPVEWLHITHDITMSIASSGIGVVAGSFSVRLPGLNRTLIAAADHDLSDGMATSNSARSIGTMALDAADFAIFEGTAPRRSELHISGGAFAFVTADYDPSQYYYPYQQAMDLWGEVGVNATLSGTLSITAGFDGTPEPLLSTRFTPPASVPLPASGLLLGMVLLGGAVASRLRPS